MKKQNEAQEFEEVVKYSIATFAQVFLHKVNGLEEMIKSKINVDFEMSLEDGRRFTIIIEDENIQ